MAGTNGAEIGFEKEMWDAACVLRGNIDAAEYKHVVLGLIFLKYLSENRELKGVLPKNFARPELDKRRLNQKAAWSDRVGGINGEKSHR